MESDPVSSDTARDAGEARYALVDAVRESISRWLGWADLTPEAQAATDWHVAHLQDAAQSALDALLAHPDLISALCDAGVLEAREGYKQGMAFVRYPETMYALADPS